MDKTPLNRDHQMMGIFYFKIEAAMYRFFLEIMKIIYSFQWASLKNLYILYL
jgi:hypothetical protein